MDESISKSLTFEQKAFPFIGGPHHGTIRHELMPSRCIEVPIPPPKLPARYSPSMTSIHDSVCRTVIYERAEFDIPSLQIKFYMLRGFDYDKAVELLLEMAMRGLVNGKD